MLQTCCARVLCAFFVATKRQLKSWVELSVFLFVCVCVRYRYTTHICMFVCVCVRLHYIANRTTRIAELRRLWQLYQVRWRRCRSQHRLRRRCWRRGRCSLKTRARKTILSSACKHTLSHTHTHSHTRIYTAHYFHFHSTLFMQLIFSLWFVWHFMLHIKQFLFLFYIYLIP